MFTGWLILDLPIAYLGVCVIAVVVSVLFTPLELGRYSPQRLMDEEGYKSKAWFLTFTLVFYFFRPAFWMLEAIQSEEQLRRGDALYTVSKFKSDFENSPNWDFVFKAWQYNAFFARFNIVTGVESDSSHPKPGSLLDVLSDTASASYQALIAEPDIPEHGPYDAYLTEFKSWAERIAKPNLQKTFEDALYISFTEFLSSLPPFALSKEDSPFSVPLINILTERSLTVLFEPLKTAGIFNKDVTRFRENQSEVFQAVKAKFYLESSLPYIRNLLMGTQFEKLLDVPIPVVIPEKLRFEGTWIVAPRGRGKTTLLSALLREDLKKVGRGKASVIVMDSKGDLIDNLKQSQVLYNKLRDRVVLWEPDADYPLAINPLTLGATTTHRIEQLEYLFSDLAETDATGKQKNLLRATLLACSVIPDANFDTLRQLLRKGIGGFEEHLRKLHPHDQRFFFEVGSNGKTDFDSPKYAPTKDELGWRIEGLGSVSPVIRSMLMATETKVDIGKEMDAGKVIIIANSSKVLGTAQAFYARLFISLIFAAAQQRAGRPNHDKLPVYLYIDEFNTVGSKDETIPHILNLCRSQNIALIAAHQGLYQIQSEQVLGALSDSSIRLANSDEEASKLAPRLHALSPDEIQLRKGKFALYARDLTSKAVTVDVPNNPVENWPKMTPAQLDEIRRDMRKRYSMKPRDFSPTPPPSANDPDDPT